jgi:hypothetical protein
MNLDRFEAAARDAFAFLEDECGLVHVPDDPAERTRHSRPASVRSTPW